MKMLDGLQEERSFFKPSAERLQAVIPSSANFTGVGCIKNALVLEVN